MDPNPILLIGVDGVVQHVHFVTQLDGHPSPCKTPEELTLFLLALTQVPALQNTSSVNSLSPSSTHSPCSVTTNTELTLQSQFYPHTLAFNHQHRVNSLSPALPTLPAFNHQHRVNSLYHGSTSTLDPVTPNTDLTLESQPYQHTPALITKRKS